MWFLTTFQSKQSLLFISGLAAAVVAALLQKTDLLVFFGVKINLSLALVLTLSLFLKNFWHYAVIAFAAAAVLTAPFWNRQSLILLGIFLAVFYCKRYLFGKPIFNNTVLILAGAFLFYLFSDPEFLIWLPVIFIQEAIYDLIVGWISFLIYETII